MIGTSKLFGVENQKGHHFKKIKVESIMSTKKLSVFISLYLTYSNLFRRRACLNYFAFPELQPTMANYGFT